MKKITPPTAVALDTLHAEKLQDAYFKFGGIPQVCFLSFAPEPAMSAYLDKIEAALRGMPALEDFVLSMNDSTLFNDDTTHTLVRIDPVGAARFLWRTVNTEFVSDYIARRVFEWVGIRCWKTAGLSWLVMALLRGPDYGIRGFGEALFEQAVHHRLRGGIRLQPEGITEGAPRLDIEILGANGEDNGFYTLPVRGGDIERGYLRQYMTPMSKLRGGESADAVWVSENAVVFFRIAVEPYCGVGLHEVEELVNELPDWLRECVYLVFVLPAGDKITKDFGRQEVRHPAGTSQAAVDK